MTEYREESEKIARACRVLGKHNMTMGALGHVSLRIDDTETMLIKGKGPDEVGLQFTRPEDIIVADFNANQVDGPEGLRPPSEAFLHTWLYKKNPEFRAVCHVHPRYAQLLTANDKPFLPFFAAGPMGNDIALEDIRTFHRGIMITDDDLGEQLANFMGNRKLALLQGHGVAVGGSSVEDVTVRTLNLGWILEMTFNAYLLGSPRSIVQEDIDALRISKAQTNRPRGSSRGQIGMLATWRYYCMMVGEYEE